MEHKISYKTEIIKDDNNKESYIQVTQITTKVLEDGQSEIINKHKYPEVPISTKFKDLLWKDIFFYNVKEEGPLKYKIEMCLSENFNKAISTASIIVEKAFNLNSSTYLIIYMPFNNVFFYDNYILSIIKEGSKPYKDITCIFILSHKDYMANSVELEKLDIDGIVKCFTPERFAEYMWERLI